MRVGTSRDRHSTAGRERVLVEPTVVARTWRWSFGGVLRSQTFKLASVLLIAGALTWNTLERMKTPGSVESTQTAPAANAPPNAQTDAQPASPADATPPPPSPAPSVPDPRRPRSPTPSPGLPIRTRRGRTILSATDATDRRRAAPASRRKKRPIQRQQHQQCHQRAQRQLLHRQQASRRPPTSRRPRSRLRFGVILPRNRPPARAHRQLLRLKKSPPLRTLLAPSPMRRRSGWRSKPTSARSLPAIAKP